nr:glyxoxylate pathway regulator [Yarrowia lipolytica]
MNTEIPDLEKQQIDHNSGSDDPQPIHDDMAPVSRIRSSGPNHEYIHIADQKFHRDDFYRAFGGTLNPGGAPQPSRKFGNPAPLGLSAFALTTLVFSLCTVQARGVPNPSIAVGLALFYGGVCQFAAGMWEFVQENTFGAAALTSYGGFWMSWAAIEMNAFGIKDSYNDPIEVQNAVGIYLFGWFIFTLMLTLCTLKSTVAFFGLFFMLMMTFLVLACANVTQHHGTAIGGGWLGIITAFFGFYNAYADLANPGNSYIVPVPLDMPFVKKD